MENVNLVVVGSGIAMIIAIVVFIKVYNTSKKRKDADVSEDESLPVNYPGIPGIILATPVVVTETCDDETCECNEEIIEDEEDCTVCEAEEAAAESAPLMITIDSINRLKTKSREFLMDSEANYSKKEADAILDDLGKAFPALGLDLHNAPFKYTVVK